MNKVVLKEFERKHIIIDILFYSMFVILGFVILNFAEMGLSNPIKHAPCMFFTIAFLSLLAYFANRREDEYEYLLFGFINVVVGTFILVYTAYPNSGFILADAVLLYSIANVLNKGYSCKKLIANRDINFFTKISITILLLFLGVFVVSCLYDKVGVGIYILGYYFTIFGLLSLLEPLNSILFDDPSLRKVIFEFLSYDKEEPKKETIKEEAKEVVPEEVAKKTTRKTTTKKSATKKASTKSTEAKRAAKKTTTKKRTTRKTTTKK